MINEMNYKEIEKVIFSAISYTETQDKNILIEIQDLIKNAKELEESIKSYKEYKEDKFIQSEHTPSRLGVFLLNYYGEQACNNRKITILNDDLYLGGATHDNSYILVLKDDNTHTKLFEGNPTAQSAPYDFNASFTKQITKYKDGNIVDTTIHAWDSFNKRYQKPIRTFDFKSDLWKGKSHLHGVNYTISINSKGNFILRNPDFTEKPAIISTEMTQEQQLNYDKYLELLDKFKKLQGYNWSNFIIEE